MSPSAMATRDPVTERRYAVRGMTCGACARHVQAALEQQSGVRAAHVDFASGVANVELDEPAPSFEAMHHAVANAGYTLDYQAGHAPDRYIPVRPILFGLAAAAAVA